MNLPPSLIQLLDSAAQSVSVDQEGGLRLGLRQQIWLELGPIEYKRGQPFPGTGLRRRYALARSCAARVMPVWIESFPEDNGPMEMLQLADEYLQGANKYGAAFNSCVDYGGDLSCQHTDLPEKSIALSAGDAAQLAALTGIADERFDPEHVDPGLHELDMDPDDWDAAYYAAEAWACTQKSTPEQEKPLRTEFWLWYLEEAVPDAWHSVTDTPAS